MADVTVRIKGLDKLIRESRDLFGVAKGVEKGIRKGSVRVEASAKTNVHKITRKLHDSTGHDITGSGLTTEGHVGPRPGYGAPRGKNRSDPRAYARVEEEGFHGTQHVRAHSRKGRPVRAHTRQVSRGGHPWLVPALTSNADRIAQDIADAVEAELERRF